VGANAKELWERVSAWYTRHVPSFSGNMHALDATTGEIRWTFASGGSVIDGPSIVNGTVYWGSGYKKIRPGTPNNKVYAFTAANNSGDD
jgi:outer membrane protein assembly factor BamB